MSDTPTGPSIDGLKFVRYLAKGGYSNVFEYERKKPKMRVAVKVLDDSRLSESQLAQFAAEAETMAELADHPYIVQVFETGTTTAGQPYVVMKYFPGDNLAVRAATTRLAVADVLRIAIQITSAVETAHRAGILHRDIKPANVLLDAHGWPGLADFGIAGRVTGEEDEEDDLGVSIPWSPPEVLGGKSNGSISSDVYSLAATFWHLLGGRSPFELPGGDNSNAALVARVFKSAPPATGRADAPASLDRLLQQALSKNPAHRPATAMELARALQGIEQEQRYSRTEIIVDTSVSTSESRAALLAEPPSQPVINNTSFAPPASTPNPGFASKVPIPDSTMVRPSRPVVSQPQAPVAQPAPPPVREPIPVAPPVVSTPVEDGTQRRPAAAKGLSPPAERGRVPLSSSASPPSPTERRPTVATSTEPAPTHVSAGVRKPVLIGVVCLLLAVAAGIAVAVSGGHSKKPNAVPPRVVSGADQGGLGSDSVEPPMVTARPDAASRAVTFQWTEATAGATFVYRINDGRKISTRQTAVVVPAPDPASVCITVAAVGPDGVEHFAAAVCGA